MLKKYRQMKTTTLVLLCIVHYSLSIAQISSLTKSKQKIWNLYEQKAYPACLKAIDSLTKINTKRFPFHHLLAARCYIKLDKKKDASRKLTDAFASGLIEDFNTDTSFLFESILVDSIEIEFIRKEIGEKGVDLFKTFQSNLNQPLIETINKIKSNIPTKTSENIT